MRVYTKDLSIKNINEVVTLYGWVSKKRDLGGLIFIDLRDKFGIMQLALNPENKCYKIADSCKTEYVIKATGKIVERSSKNPNIPTGDIELEVEELEILSTCDELPFVIEDNTTAGEDLRLKYRYLDMRRNKIKDNLMLRAEVLHFLRNKMYDLGFTEVQTPILTASSPEGARDFVVPSRLFKGKFYALPQAPQIYKELLMVGGLGKYFQIAPCFRDEDARADRTLEFYQLDLEMSFVEEDEVLNVGEEIFYDVFSKFSNKKVSPRPFRRIAYLDAIDKYGSDKPDLRFGMEIEDISDIFKDTEFTVFKNILEDKGIINAIVAKNAADKYSRKDLDNLTDTAKKFKASGLAYLKIGDEITGSIAKVVSEKEVSELKEKLNLENNDLVLIISGKKSIVKKSLGQLRLIMEDYNTKKPEDILAYQFDFVCNGNEMASGAIRNHDLDSLAKGFSIVGYERSEVEERFKSIFTSFKYGCPPHGGMAPGIDRILMLIKDEPNLREVQAFPPSASGQDLMMGSPSELTREQLEELGIIIKKQERKEDENE